MRKSQYGTWLVVVLVWVMGPVGRIQAQTAAPFVSIDDDRVEQIASMLADTAAGYGPRCQDRSGWDSLLHSGNYASFLKEMEDFVFPEFSEEDYFSLFNGTAASSARGLNMMRDRAAALSKLTWAECLENSGRFIPMLEAGLRDVLHQPSWVSPRNDFDFKNYHGVEYSVELTSALYAHTLAQTLYMLGDKLAPDLRDQVVDAIWKRVFDPVLRKIKTQNKARENGFLVATNNYNHVCLSGVVGAALTILPDKRERALFAYIGEYYAQNGLQGFGDDGYCSEGIGYFNYGFGHFVLLRESLWQATAGRLDLFVIPKVTKIARYGVDLAIINGVYPAISDSHVGGTADSAMMKYLSRSLGLGLTAYENKQLAVKADNNRMDVLAVFPKSSLRIASGYADALGTGPNIRSYFDQSAVLILRPATVSSSAIGIAIKGGHNQEHHNHNDVGSYTFVQGKEIMVGDPGSIPYTADIFDLRYRYNYKTVASYGHPVPLVAGRQQRPGLEAVGKVIHAGFSESEDVVTLDIAAAYDVPSLKRLTRTLRYQRGGKARMTVCDAFAFEEPQAFETALITRAAWKQVSDDRIVLERNGEKTEVLIACPGNPVTLQTEEISEGGKPYTRIAITLTKPALSGEIQVSYQAIQ